MGGIIVDGRAQHADTRMISAQECVASHRHYPSPNPRCSVGTLQHCEPWDIGVGVILLCAAFALLCAVMRWTAKMVE